MKKSRRLIVAVFAAVCAVCLAVSLAACVKNDKNSYGVGEEGSYYYTQDSSTEYILKMESGEYMITLGGDTASKGSYTVNGDTYGITFKASKKSSFTGTLYGNEVLLDYDGGTYVFHLDVNYDVKFVGAGQTVTQSVRNGKPAEEVDGERSGYVFLGWYADEGYTVPYTFTEEISGDTTIYGRYEAVNASALDYTVTFDYGDGTVETATTMNGKIYSRYLPETDGGWWVSATNKRSELTYRYDEEELHEDTIFYSVPETVLGVSVYGDGVTWDRVAISTAISIYGEDGVAYATGTVSSATSYAYDFSSLPTGKYTVTVSNSYGEESRTYVSGGLYRVSGLSVSDSLVLTYMSVEGAEEYIVRVTDAAGEHVVENGTNTGLYLGYYTMPADGLRITVYAVADGMYTSESAELNFFAGLSALQVSVSGGRISWTASAGAEYYELYIDGELFLETENTEYDAKYMGHGTYCIAVRPVAHGYYSETSETYSYVKNTVATPTITGMVSGTISWNPVDGASGYVLKIGDEVYNDITGTSFDTSSVNFPEGAVEVEISISASASGGYDSSPYSDPLTVTVDGFGDALTYENGVVHWNYSLAAGKYIVKINNEDEIEVQGKNCCEITFTKDGDNTVTVSAVKSDGTTLSSAGITVYAYAVLLDARGGAVDGGGVIYLAEGDTLGLLPEANLEGYEFSGWYTLPDEKNFEKDSLSLTYSGQGVLVNSRATFTAESTKTYYAFYTPNLYTVTIDVGSGYFLDGDGEALTESDGSYVTKMTYGVYFGKTFTLPVAATSDSTKIFNGWYSMEGALGDHYTDARGQNLLAWDIAGDATLYAGYMEVLSFSLVTYGGKTVASVSKGYYIDRVTEVTIPETCVVDGETYTVGYIGSTAFNSCKALQVINIPDTVMYIQTVNNGYDSATGAFAESSALREVNVYATGDSEDTTREIYYYSEDGVLYQKNSDGEGVTLVYYPYGRVGSFTVADRVSNENEYEAGGQKIYRDVTAIAVQAFANNPGLWAVTVPYTVTTVGNQAFYNATGLIAVTFTESGTGSSLTIEANAFQGCTALETVTLSYRLVNFDNSIFSGCTSLKEINVTGGNGSYTSRDGYLCDSTGSKIVYVPGATTEFRPNDSRVTSIDTGAFVDCESLETVEIGAGITSIGDSAFEGLGSVKTLVFDGTANSGALTIGARAFYGCTGLTEVTLPVNLLSVGDNAFGMCTNLVSVTVNSTQSNLSISGSAFETDSEDVGRGYERYSVTEVKIASGAAFLMISDVFGEKVTSVAIESNNYFVDSANNVVYNQSKTVISYFPYNLTTYTVPDEMTTINAYVFRGRATLTTVTINRYVTEIGEGAFADCTGLKTVTINGGTGEASSLKICAYAFYGCSALVNLTLPDRLAEVGSYAFASCSSLTSFNIPRSLSTIGGMDANIGRDMKVSGVFHGCAKLSTITVDTANTSYKVMEGGLYSFAGNILYYVMSGYDWTNGEIKIPSTVTEICEYAFDGNGKITKITFAEREETAGKVELGEHAFANIASLVEIELPEGLEKIPAYAFSGCTKLQSISVSSTVTEMGEYALSFYDASLGNTASYDNSSLTAITVTFAEGSRLKSIGDYALYGTHLASLDMTNLTALESIGERSFAYCRIDQTETIVFPGSMTYVGTYAMYYAHISKIEMPGVETVADSAFELSYLTEVKLGNLRSLGNRAFYESLSHGIAVTIEAYSGDDSDYAGVVIGNRAFEGIGDADDYRDKEVYPTVSLPEGTVSIGYDCFAYSYIHDMDIPASVKSIGETCFASSWVNKVTFVTHSDGYSDLECIEDNAFESCSHLNEITFPATGSQDNVTEIKLGKQVLTMCTDLKKMYISESINDIVALVEGMGDTSMLDAVTVSSESKYFSTVSGVKMIFNKEQTAVLWAYNPNKATIDFTDETQAFGGMQIEEIGPYAFASPVAWNTTKIVLPATFKKIDERAFYSNTKIKTVDMSLCTGLEGVDEYAFSGCTALETLTFPEGITTITEVKERTYYNCSKLATANFPSTITTVGGYAFYNCKALTGFDLSSATTIGEAAFKQSGLVEIELAEGLTSLGDSDGSEASQFEGCASLTTVKLPSTLTVLGKKVFYNCTSLTTINLNYVQYIYGTDNTDSTFGLCGFEEIAIPATVRYIGGYAFYNCASLTTVTFDAACEVVGEYMFYRCTALASVTLPTNMYVDSIPAGMFEGCTALGKIYLPANVLSVGYEAFSGCSALSDINLTYILSVGGYAFYNCAGLVAPVMNDALVEVGSYAFAGCTNLAEIDTRSVTSIGDHAFYGCSSLGALDLSLLEVLESSDTHIFYGCSKLSGIVLSDGLNMITNYMFYNCGALTSFVVPSGVTAVGNYAFYGCTGLEAITLPSGLVSIGSYAFYHVYVDEIWIGGGVTSVSANAFNGYTGELYIDGTYSFVIEAWGDGWVSSTAFKGDVYYRYDPDETASAGYHYWRESDGRIITGEYSG